MHAPLSEAPATLPELMTVKETAEYLRMPIPTIYYLIGRGQLPAIQIGSLWRIRRSLVDTQILQKAEEKWNARTRNTRVRKGTIKNSKTPLSISLKFHDRLLGTLTEKALAQVSSRSILPTHHTVSYKTDLVITDFDIGYAGSLPLEFTGRIIRIIPDENLRQGETGDTPITEITSLEFGENPAEVLRKLLKLK